jgi:serine/threonine-protein kinase
MAAPSDPAAADPDSAHDRQLAQLIDELTRQLREHGSADLDAVARQHPDLADELRHLWGTVQFAEAFAPPNRPPSRSAMLPPTLPLAPSSPSEPPRLFGDYELLEVLGRGGMGVVYKARQRSLNRVVALKVTRHGQQSSPEELARFRAEAKAAARLDNHGNIVPVYEVGEWDGQAYFSMKFVDGTTLSALAAGGPLPPHQAAQYLLAIARAVDYAHQHGILHRDLKPSNVLLDREGQPHVTDFGLAKQVQDDEHLTRTGTVLGTPCYMSPEQAFPGHGALTPASDVYSLGTILYELLTGRPPFRAATTADTLLLVREQEPVPPRFLNPRVDPDLELICLQCLQKQPALRYSSAGRLADDLEAYLAGEAPSVRSSSISYYVSRMLRETHHAAVLENWGVLWMWHSLAIFLLCLLTNALAWSGVTSHWPYLLLWGPGLVVWGAIFWALRRRGGPVMFVEKQIAHIWGAAVIGTIGVFVVELLLDLKALELSPILAILAGTVFVAKGGMLSGAFYIAALVLFLTAIPMALLPGIGPLLFGIVSAACFFLPGYKYYRQRQRSVRLAEARGA